MASARENMHKKQKQTPLLAAAIVIILARSHFLSAGWRRHHFWEEPDEHFVSLSAMPSTERKYGAASHRSALQWVENSHEYVGWAPWKWEEPGRDLGMPGAEEDFASAAPWGSLHSGRLVGTPFLKGFGVLNQCSTRSSICNYSCTGLIAKVPQGWLAGSWKQEELNPPSPTLKFFLLNLLCFTVKAMVKEML